MNNPMIFVDPWGLFAELIMDDMGVDGGAGRLPPELPGTFTSGVITGLADPIRGVTSTVTFALNNHPKTTARAIVLPIAENAVSNPVGFAIDTVFFTPQNPWTHVRNFYRAYQTEGRYGLGRATGAHITHSAVVVASYGITKGIDYMRWHNLDGSIRWPANDGFAGTQTTSTLQPGVRVDRFGAETGRFVSPAGTPLHQRSLPAGSHTRPFHVYEVVRPVDVQAGRVAPWFGQSGGGTQFQFNQSIGDLVNSGVLRRIP